MERNRTAGLELIKRFEGFEADAYRCPAGKWTIGYGFTKGVKKGDKLTREEADKRLLEEYKVYEAAVLKLVRVSLSDNQLAALTSFTFNLGQDNLASSTLLRKLNAGDYKGAAAEFGKWKFAGGKALLGLVRRRAAERLLFEKAI